MKNNNMKTESVVSKPLITTDFTTILLIIALIIGFWLKRLSNNKELLSEMADETLEMHLVSQLIFTTHEQTTTLTAMSSAKTLDKKNELYQQFIKIEL